jgi:hypothetical protein
MEDVLPPSGNIVSIKIFIRLAVPATVADLATKSFA